MPRGPRIVFQGVPYHVTQRGNRREQVFFSDADRIAYLEWLRQYADAHGVSVLAYCLMPNHVHLVAVPARPQGLYRALQPLHMRYAQRINRARGWKGHVWQGRYFASALDEPYLWAAIRYVERNPVRARFVAAAEDYPWSSASGHCGQWSDPLLETDPSWCRQVARVGNWSRWLSNGDDEQALAALRLGVDKGLPCGSDAFVAGLEQRSGRVLRHRPRGRPAKEKGTHPFSKLGCVPFSRGARIHDCPPCDWSDAMPHARGQG